ncbi:MmgE/PrpD family protein [Nocardiopsis flavescens]
MSGGPVRAFARFAGGLGRDDPPEAVRAYARRLLLDFLGTAVGGRSSAEVRALTGPGQLGEAPHEAGVLGTGRVLPAADAAFANGCAADAYEHQDGYRFGGFHPSHLIPPVLALAQVRGATLGELVTAVIAGYEVADRIGEALHPGATPRGWFPTAAAYGGAAAAARAAGGGAGRIERALGLVAFHVPAVTLESIFAGVTGKPAFAGQIARTGAWAALASGAGLGGWDGVLDHPRGPLALMAGEPRPLSVDDLGERWSLTEVHQKRFAACRHTHAAAQAAVELATARGLGPGDLRSVEAEVYDVAAELVDRPVHGAPTAAAATLSLQYVLACAVRHGTVHGSHYTPERLADPDVLALASRVRVRTAPDLQAAYPESTPARITVTTADGERFTHGVDVPVGDGRSPLEEGEAEAKFLAYTEPVVGADAARAALDAVLSGEDVPVTEVIAALTLPVGAREEAP